MVPAGWESYVEGARPAEATAVRALLAKGNINLADRLPQPVALDEAGTALAGRVQGRSHWITWRPAGTPALFVQQRGASQFLVIPRDGEGHADGDGDGDGDGIGSPAATVLKLRPGMAPAFVLRDAAGVPNMWPVAVLEGVVAWRTVAPGAAPADREAARRQTLATLMAGIEDQNRSRRGTLTFFCHECLWWRTPRPAVDVDFQARMVAARGLIEGEPGGRTALLPSSGHGLAMAYRPHMAPSQAAVITRDVPPPLVGCTLDGIELRPTDAAAFRPLVLRGPPAAYDFVIQLLWHGPAVGNAAASATK